MNVSAWLNTHRTQALLGAGGLVAGYAVYKSRHPGTPSGSPAGGILGTAGNLSPSGTVSGAYGPYDSSQLDQYNQLAGALSSANDQINAIQTQLASTAVAQIPASSSGQGTPAPQPGEGIIQTAQGPMVILGQEKGTGPQAYSGYDVTGGAPVYYGNATDLAQGTQFATAGSFVYTPEAYAPLISSTATHQG